MTHKHTHKAPTHPYGLTAALKANRTKLFSFNFLSYFFRFAGRTLPLRPWDCFPASFDSFESKLNAMHLSASPKDGLHRPNTEH